LKEQSKNTLFSILGDLLAKEELDLEKHALSLPFKEELDKNGMLDDPLSVARVDYLESSSIKNTDISEEIDRIKKVLGVGDLVFIRSRDSLNEIYKRAQDSRSEYSDKTELNIFYWDITMAFRKPARDNGDVIVFSDEETTKILRGLGSLDRVSIFRNLYERKSGNKKELSPELMVELERIQNSILVLEDNAVPGLSGAKGKLTLGSSGDNKIKSIILSPCKTGLSLSYPLFVSANGLSLSDRSNFFATKMSKSLIRVISEQVSLCDEIREGRDRLRRLLTTLGIETSGEGDKLFMRFKNMEEVDSFQKYLLFKSKVVLQKIQGRDNMLYLNISRLDRPKIESIVQQSESWKNLTKHLF
jgi:hypothetical protein